MTGGTMTDTIWMLQALYKGTMVSTCMTSECAGGRTDTAG